jgi:sugar (pentulose or hexulose) kinase
MIAVLDFGKTNTKLLVFAADGQVRHSARTRPVWRMIDGVSVLDDAALAQWAHAALEEADAACAGQIMGVMVAAHGCTFALTDADGLARPILDYEQELPGPFADAVHAGLPPYSETFAPPRPQGFNYGRHLLWLQHLEPHVLARTGAILGYPQYWSWRLGGRPAAEYSYMGCHSHIWAPARRDFASVVAEQGWREKMPDFAPAGAVIGELKLADRAIAVHNGVHDSNAALHAYRSVSDAPFTLVSTGTWVIIFNPDCPLDALDARFDHYCNVDVNGDPVPTIGFMGGREFDVIAGDAVPTVDRASIQRVIDQRIMVPPAFAAAGPFGHVPAPALPPMRDAAERAAVAMLYVALMTDFCLDSIRSDTDLVLDGGLASGGVLAELLAQLRPRQVVKQAEMNEGTAAGAASLAFAAHGVRLELPRPAPVVPSNFVGLDEYRRQWRANLPSIDGTIARSAA